MSLWGSIIGAAVDLYSNSQNQQGSQNAAHNSQQGLDFLKSVYGDAKGYQAPYLGLGTTGANGLQKLAAGDYSGFYNSPDYQSARDAMTYAADHSAAANNNLNSGGYLADLSHAQGNLANSYLGGYRGSLMNLAQMGQNSATALGNLGAGVGSNLLQGYGQLSAAQQQGYDSNGQLAASLGGLFNNYMQGRNQPLTDSSYGSMPSDNYGFGGTPSSSGGGDNYGFGSTSPYGGYQDPNYGFGGGGW
jgi:hypothetical protein